MSLYVDELFMAWSGPLKGKMVCHMFTEPREDDALVSFAESIGLRSGWIQHRGSAAGKMAHFDITEHFRIKAISAGAIEVDRNFVADMVRTHREHYLHGDFGQLPRTSLAEGEN